MEKQHQKGSDREEVFHSETKAHLAAIINNAPGFIYSIDPDWRLITINKPLQNALQEFFGFTINPGDSVIESIKKINPALANEWEGVYARALAGESCHFFREFDLVKKSFWEF